MTTGVVGSVEKNIPEPLAGSYQTIIDLFPDYNACVGVKKAHPDPFNSDMGRGVVENHFIRIGLPS